MARLDDLLADPSNQPPAAAPLPGPRTGTSRLDQMLADPNNQPPAAAAAPAPAAGPDPGFFQRNIGGPLAYVGGRALSGLLQFGQPFVAGQDLEAGVPMTPQAGPAEANQMVFGTPIPEAPGTMSRYAGAGAEALTRNPFFSVLQPEAVLGGALAGQGAEDAGAGPLGQAAAGFVGGGLAGAGRAGVNALLQVGAIKRLASRMGSSTTKQQAGEVAKAEAESWLTDETNPTSMPAQERTAWAPFDAALPRTAEAPGGPQVNLTETEKTLKSILKVGAKDPRIADIAAGTGGGAASKLFRWLTGEEPLADIPAPPRGRVSPTIPEPQLPGGLRPIEAGGPGPGSVPGGKLKPIAGPVRDTIDPMEWDGVRGLRTWIGQGMRDPILRNIGETNLNRLYASLSSDMKATAETHGLLDEFNAANTVSQELRTVAEEHIGKIAQAVTPEAAYKAAVQGSAAGGTRLSILRQHLPTTTDELGAVHLHHALEDPKVWNGLSPEAKAQLVPDGGAREAVERAMKLPPVGDGGGAVRSILGGEVGGNIGQAFLDTTLGKAAGSVIGAIAPHALVGMKLLGRNPASLRLPAIGAASAPLQEPSP